MSEKNSKPLHVRVAEALGCEAEYDNCMCAPGIVGHDNNGVGILRYDLDWAAAAPLIMQYVGELVNECEPNEEWVARSSWQVGWERRFCGAGDTPLIAVCNLILALKDAGKLTQTRAAS